MHLLIWAVVLRIHTESVNEGLSPETAAKAEKIKSTMIGKNRDKLFKAYGKDAEKVAHGRAINQAKKAAEKEEPVNEEIVMYDGEEALEVMRRVKTDHLDGCRTKNLYSTKRRICYFR